MDRQGTVQPADREILNDLRMRLLNSVEQALNGVRHVLLLDAPTHRNAGDLLILQGELTILNDIGVSVLGIHDRHVTPWARITRMPEEIGIVLHGGGNLGGLYPQNDEYRERVIEACPRHRILLFPQSVHFPTSGQAEDTRRRYGQAENIHFLMRDSRSLELFSTTVPEQSHRVSLCPDAAFGAHVGRSSSPVHDLLYLRREDSESKLPVADSLLSALDIRKTDWPTLSEDYAEYRAIRAFDRRITAWTSRNRSTHSVWGRLESRMIDGLYPLAQTAILRAHARATVERLVRTLCQGRVVLTDRLHAHVGASLLGLPNIVLDSADGKVEALIGDWTRPLSTTHYARDPREAAAKARSLIEQIRSSR